MLREPGMRLGGWSGIVTLLWLVLLIALFQRINSVNGLAGILGLFSMGLLACGAAASGTAFSGLCAVGMAGSLIGFLVYNLPPTRIQLGSSGAGLLGFLVGNLSITHPYRDQQHAMLAALILAVLGASFVTWRGALKQLPALPLTSRPVPRNASRGVSPRPHTRR